MHHDDSPVLTTSCKQNAHVGMPIGQHFTDGRFWSYAASEVKVDLTAQSYRRSSRVGALCLTGASTYGDRWEQSSFPGWPTGLRFGYARILLRCAVAYLLLAVSACAADALGVGGVRFHCGCDESCWCKRPGLTLLRWVTPRGWHHLGLTADEMRAGIER